MKVLRKDILIDITDIHPDDYFMLVYVVSIINNLLKKYELDTITDNLAKKKFQKHWEELLEVLSQEMGSKTAESLDEGLIRKVLEKFSQKEK